MTEREQFEEWIAENRPDVELYRRDVKGSTRFGEYCKSSAQESWEVWQASRREALKDAHSAVRRCINVRDAEDAIRALSQKESGE